jgi:hypothetical protein
MEELKVPTICGRLRKPMKMEAFWILTRFSLRKTEELFNLKTNGTSQTPEYRHGVLYTVFY